MRAFHWIITAVIICFVWQQVISPEVVQMSFNQVQSYTGYEKDVSPSQIGRIICLHQARKTTKEDAEDTKTVSSS